LRRKAVRKRGSNPFLSYMRIVAQLRNNGGRAVLRQLESNSLNVRICILGMGLMAGAVKELEKAV
jgi:hypothetical protein